jgi:LmbE family N-acetylglucosaminyl deacetylase
MSAPAAGVDLGPLNANALAALPLLPSTAAATWGPTLVVAPHPDDESLGCGGAIALLRQHGLPVTVLMVSDGTGSHPHSRRYPPAALCALREQEARDALALLGVPPEAVSFLGLPDRYVPFPDDNGFPAALAAVRDLLANLRPATVLLPWRRDPHCDHRASWQLVTEALQHEGQTPRLLEYPIWVYELAAHGDAPTDGETRAWRLDIASVLPTKLAAVQAHRSQLGQLIDDDPDGFCLTPRILAHFSRPYEVYLEATNL